MQTTPRTALQTISLAATALLLSASTMAATLAPFAADIAQPMRIVDLPRVVVAGHRATHVAIVDLPRVVVTQRRSVAADTLVVKAKRDTSAI